MNLKVLFMSTALLFLGATAAQADGYLWAYHDSIVEIEIGPGSFLSVNFVTPSKQMSGVGINEHSVLFDGNEEESGTVVGKLYSFKKGCDPLPYDAQGSFDNNFHPKKLTLHGAPVIWAEDGGCRAVGYDEEERDTRIVITYLGTYDDEGEDVE
jgi:hypothetical protein